MSEAQKILIVGGGQGIGWEVAKAILKLSPQAHVAIFGYHLEDDIWKLPARTNGRVSVILKGDLTSNEDRQSFIGQCLKGMGGIDTLVFTAGVITPIERIEKLDMEEVKRTFDVNVFGCISMIYKRCLWKDRYFVFRIDKEISYHGWIPYCTTKAALTRYIGMLAHEEPLITVQGVYPKLTRTKMTEDVIAGKYKEILADYEIEKFRVWNEIGDEMVEPPEWCGEVVGKLALGLYAGGRSVESWNYEVHVPSNVR